MTCKNRTRRTYVPKSKSIRTIRGEQLLENDIDILMKAWGIILSAQCVLCAH